MSQNQEAIELNKRYQFGQRNFQEFQLSRADLKGLNLQNTDFGGVDFSYANLRDVDFSGADLREACLNEADLTGINLSGANLAGASLVKTFLIKANCDQTNLQDVNLTGAYLTQTNFKEANFRGACLSGARLAGVDLGKASSLEEAYYDDTTRFGIDFNPQQVGMKKIDSQKNTVEKTEEIIASETPITHPTITVQKLLEILSHLSQTSRRYLGKTMTQKYWDSSRPNFQWLEQFEMNSSGEIMHQDDLEAIITSSQLQYLQTWINNFTQSCCQIFKNYPKMLDAQLISLVISPKILNIDH
ncbi:MAG: pentapeptide repeat-containing protein [Cyanobacteria bacterium P01_G01_bin.49]